MGRAYWVAILETDGHLTSILQTMSHVTALLHINVSGWVPHILDDYEEACLSVIMALIKPLKSSFFIQSPDHLESISIQILFQNTDTHIQ